MLFQVDPRASTPVYQQIIEQVRYGIASGRLRAGDRLEPIRELAVRLRVNRNTIARAYSELEREGLITTRVGSGSVIGGSGPAASALRARRMLATKLDALLAEAHQHRLSEQDFLQLVQERMARVQLRGATDSRGSGAAPEERK